MTALSYLKALADNTRLRLFNILSRHELNVNEIIRVMGMGQSRISRHLKILTDGGLLSLRRDGLWAFYSAADNDACGRLCGAVRELIENDELGRQDLVQADAIVRERSLRTQRFFDSVAGSWEELKTVVLGSFDLNQAIAELVRPCGSAVDAGCGTGDLLRTLSQKARHVIGVDSSPRMLEQARRQFQNQDAVELRLGEIEHLPLRDEEVDLAVMNMVLHHLPLPQQGLREVHRALKPHKSFVLADLDKHEREMLRARHGDRWLGFEPVLVRQWLKQAGFELVGEKTRKLGHNLAINIYIARKTS